MERCLASRTLRQSPRRSEALLGTLLSTLLILSTFGCDGADQEARSLSKENSQTDSRVAKKVRILAAVSLKEAIIEVASAFEATQKDASLQVITGPSNALAQQIIAGAEASIYLSANPQWAEALEHQGLTQTQVPLLSNSLVLVVPTGNPMGISNVDNFLSGDIGVIAMANPNVPLGSYTRQMFEKLKFAHSPPNIIKIVHASDAKQTLALVERGEVDAGIVYATDALSSNYVEVARSIPREHHAPIVYPALLLKQDLPNHTAEAFFHFLQSSTASSIFERHGFQSLLPTPSQN